MAEQNIHALLESYLYRLKPGQAAADLLQEFIDIDVTASDLEKILRKNQVYMHLFERFVNKATSKAAPTKDANGESTDEGHEISPPHRLISLLGLIGSRNLLLSLRMHRMAMGKFPFSEDGKLEIQAANFLKTALAVEDLCQRNKIEYSETAFAMGCIYDWISLIAKQEPSFKTIEPFFQSTWKQSQRLGIICIAIARKMPGFNHTKFAFSAGASVGLGKILLAMHLKTPYLDFYAKEEKLNKVNLQAFYLKEFKQFPYTHLEASALILRIFTPFSHLSKAIHHGMEPYALQKSDPKMYKLSLVVHQALIMAHDWKIPADLKDPIIQSWKKPYLKELKLRDQDYIDIAKWTATIS